MNLSDQIFATVIEPFLKPRIKKRSIQAIKGYVTAVKFGRYAVLGIFGLGAFAALMVVGLFMAIVGAIGLLPVEPTTVALTTLMIGLVLFVGSLIGAIVVFSQRRWLKMSKSYELMEAVLSPWPGILPPISKGTFALTEEIEEAPVMVPPPLETPASVVPAIMH